MNGFGNINSEYWLGRHKIYRLTRWKPFHSELRIDLRDFQNNAGYAKYSTFHLGRASTDYTLQVAGYRGTIGDDLTYNNGMKFTTLDRHNDFDSHNCASQYHGGVGGIICVIEFILMECTTATIQSPIGRGSLQMVGEDPPTP